MIATVINYCTIDYKFIKACISETRKFSDLIIVSYCDHLFDGTPENKELIEKTKQENNYPNVKFLEFEYDENLTKQYGTRYWHNSARWLGTQKVKEYTIPSDPVKNYVLFLDADEIVEGEKIKQLSNAIWNYDVFSLCCYWYFREPIYQAKQLEQAGTFIALDKITPDLIFSEAERWAYRHTNLNYKENITLDQSPLCHHFSWVRTEEEMLKKVKNWGHNKDRNWTILVEEEFTHEFNGTDFVHGYEYNIVDNRFQI